MEAFDAVQMPEIPAMSEEENKLFDKQTKAKLDNFYYSAKAGLMGANEQYKVSEKVGTAGQAVKDQWSKWFGGAGEKGAGEKGDTPSVSAKRDEKTFARTEWIS